MSSRLTPFSEPLKPFRFLQVFGQRSGNTFSALVGVYDCGRTRPADTRALVKLPAPLRAAHRAQRPTGRSSASGAAVARGFARFLAPFSAWLQACRRRRQPASDSDSASLSLIAGLGALGFLVPRRARRRRDHAAAAHARGGERSAAAQCAARRARRRRRGVQRHAGRRGQHQPVPADRDRARGRAAPDDLVVHRRCRRDRPPARRGRTAPRHRHHQPRRRRPSRSRSRRARSRMARARRACSNSATSASASTRRRASRSWRITIRSPRCRTAS